MTMSPDGDSADFWPHTRATLLDGLACSSGESAEAAWRQFKTHYEKPIVGLCEQKCLNKSDCAKVFQDVMVAVFNKGEFAYDPTRGVKFRTWLGTIVKNKINDIIKAKMRKIRLEVPILSEDSEGNPVELPLPAPDDFFHEWDREYAKAALARSLAWLRKEVEPRTYQAFELLVIQEWPVEKVAAAVGMKPNAVYLVRHRCVARLKTIRQEILDE